MPGRPTLAVLPVLALLWLGIAAYLYQQQHAGLSAAARDTQNLSQAFEENIRRTIEAIDTTIRTARIARRHDPGHFDLSNWERESGLARNVTLQLSLVDRDGIFVNSSLDEVAARHDSIADREHFRVPRDARGDALFISRPVLGRISHRWAVQFVRRLVDAQGSFDGVVVASLDPAFLSRFYHSLDIGKGALLLVGQDGIVRSAAPDGIAALGEDLSGAGLIKQASAAAQGTVRLRATADGVERIYSWRRLDDYGLLAVVGFSTADAMAGYRLQQRSSVVIGLVVSVLSLLASVVLARHRRDIMQSREVLWAAVENISQGLQVVDGQRRLAVMNGRVAELLDLPPHLTVPGTEFDAIIEWQIAAGEFDNIYATEMRRLAESGGLQGGTSVYRRTRRNGTVLEVRTKMVENGLAVRTFTDVTEQERTEQVLADARDAAEAAARAKSEFLAVMSHEIRTPLNGVIGIAGLLEEMDLDATQRDYVRLIRQSGDHLLELINDILDFSRLEAQRLELEEIAFDPRALVQGVVGIFLVQAGGKGLHLSASMDEGVPAAVSGDPGRLRQVLLNLVSNAVKFTDQGWVTLRMAHEPAGDGQVRLLFSVADSGIGIRPDAIERMFQQFTQMDSSISRRFGGSGLGLAICRRLVEMMGGVIGVESELGQGSTFRFDVTLRLVEAPPEAAVPTPAEPAAGPGLKVLLTEDNPTNRLVAMQMLARLGYRADAVGDGVEALAALAVSRYDLILMDVMMPRMDGLTATRQIRKMKGETGRITIVGLTAGSGEAGLAACLEAGMDAVTTKPLTLEGLRSAIAEGRSMASRVVQPAEPKLKTARLQELSEMLGKDAVAEILQAFAEGTRAHLETMKQAAEAGDTGGIHRLAHSVLGAARNVGADGMAGRAARLESGAGSMSAEQIAAEIGSLQSELEVLVGSLALAAVN